MNEWQNLADEIKIKVHNRGSEDAYPDVMNEASISRKVNKIQDRLDSISDEITYSWQDVPGIVCDMFTLDLRPDHEFQEYWIDRIVNAPGFADYAPQMNADGLPTYEPFGWLTKHHVIALKSHGYRYKFAFWEEPVGETRGHLWIQTDQGPLMLSDKTDAVSLKTNFPVQVFSAGRQKKFKLKERDLEKHSGARSVLLRFFGRR